GDNRINRVNTTSKRREGAVESCKENGHSWGEINNRTLCKEVDNPKIAED
ncbi:hypothetical protein chiPu_0026626, partial [Chiloscyllium punctatum]|nr:hypothetical protein [Chiloscyllium punctatum]